MVPMTSTYQFQGWNNFSMAEQPIHKISYCLQANNWELLHMQHHGKVTSFPSWILPMISWSYVQDRYLSYPRTILGSSFHTYEASVIKKCISISKSLTNTQHMELEPLCSAQLSFPSLFLIVLFFCIRNWFLRFLSCSTVVEKSLAYLS